MPKLSWNEIRARASAFSVAWSSATREQADKQTFWNEFFDIFGVPRRTVASFEEPVRNLRGTYSFIDLFWKRKLLVEHKTAGQSLEAAETQAFDYIQGLLIQRRGDEVPRYVLLSDFQRFALYDLEPEDETQRDLPLFRDRFRYHRIEFPLADLPLHVREFAFIPGYQLPAARPHDQANLDAVTIMAGVHDALKKGGFTGHDLERLLVRILFCLFAQSTGIFEPDAFRLYIEDRTQPDGSDLGRALNELFAVLDKPRKERQRNLDEALQAFEYINGELFRERLDFAAFDSITRKALLEAANFNWSQISPAIFGALFQEVMNDTERRKIGAHYTSERDILKVIKPLFLESLRAELEAVQKDRSGRRASRLEDLRVRLTQLKFLDPACGCGNFLVIAYRELRALELDVLKAQHGSQQQLTLDEVNRLSQVDVHQFYGIEIEEWPARIAEVALWLMDHQCNLRILDAFSQPFVRLPLKQSPHIHIGNALRMDWNDLLPAAECSYILGNPPFVGAKHLSNQQPEDVTITFEGYKKVGILDYVACWYLRAADYMVRNPRIRCAFVSTNSITQGEQVGVLWNILLAKQVHVFFAHRTFAWSSEARGGASVHCVIVGFSLVNQPEKQIYEYSRGAQQPTLVAATRINPYLVDAPNLTLLNRSGPLCEVPPITMGNKPIDNGNYFFTPGEKAEFLSAEPKAAGLFRRWYGADEFLNGIERWFLWLGDTTPGKLDQMPLVRARIRAVQKFRTDSKSQPTKELAKKPTRLHIENFPSHRYLLIPCHSSEARDILPMGFVDPDILAGNANLLMHNASLFHFGNLQSRLHMAWVRVVCGRLKSDYRYSSGLVYNNYPWPQNPTPTQTAKVEELAQAVLDARDLYPDSTLAQLYDPLLMPPELSAAHQRLDRAVERCYRPEPFTSDRERVEFLFALYEKLTAAQAAPLLPAPAQARRRRGGRRSA